MVAAALPENKPTPQERDALAHWLVTGLRMVVPTARVIIALGGFAWQALRPVLATAGYGVPRPRPAFAPGAGSPARSPDRTKRRRPRLLPPEPAEHHVPRPRHTRHVRRHLHPSQGHVRWRVTVAADFADSSVSSRGSRLPP
jgi:hypothetical protein